MKKIILSIIIVLLFTITPLTSANPIRNKNFLTINTTDIPTSHLIENVTYVSQREMHCFFSCLEMIYRYNNVETNQNELSSLQGKGYSLVYQPRQEAKTHRPFIKPSYKYYIQTSIVSNQGIEDTRFVAGLLGFEVEKYISETRSTNPIASWNSYWIKLKQHISNNTPLVTCVDIFVWPLFLELHNLSYLPSLISRGAHSVLVVGYNEKNGSVCVHDPHAGECNKPEKGTYYWISKNIFRRAVRRAYWDVVFANFHLYIFKKVSEEPMPKDEIFKRCHERNIEKMKGNKSAYDEKFFRDNFEKFGIKAWQQIKTDFEKSFLQLLPIYRFLNRFTWMPFDMIAAFDLEAKLRYEVANYLNMTSNMLENETLKDICKYDAALFYNETIKLEGLKSLTIDLKDAVERNTLLKSYSESRLIIEDICHKIDEIITIEEAIIAGPGDDII